MTREKFQAQFETRIIVSDTELNIMTLDDVRFDTPVYRMLNKLAIIKDDGNYYIHI